MFQKSTNISLTSFPKRLFLSGLGWLVFTGGNRGNGGSGPEDRPGSRQASRDFHRDSRLVANEADCCEMAISGWWSETQVVQRCSTPVLLSGCASDWSVALGDVTRSATLLVGEGVLHSTPCITCHRFRSVSKIGRSRVARVPAPLCPSVSTTHFRRMNTVLFAEIERLSPAEKLPVVEELSNQIARESNAVEPPGWHDGVLAEDAQRYASDPSRGNSWEKRSGASSAMPEACPIRSPLLRRYGAEVG